MRLLVPFIILLWAFRIARNILSFVYFWYIKEYRFDRMWIYIKTEGLKFLFAPQFRHPPIRPKALVLGLSSFIFLALFYFLLPFSPIVNIGIVDFLSFSMVSLFVFLMKLPTMLYHEYIYFLANQKLQTHPPMMVIGITGSVGKTTTKEFLATILATKFQVLKTRESQNSAIGVAETILKDLKPDHEVFVVEMAAYKKGEIAKIAKLVKPEIGIVTAINEQHLDLFGSLENTMEAKYELPQHLSGKSLAIFNADNAYTRHMAERAQKQGKKVWMYTKQDNMLSFSDKTFAAKNISVGMDTITFSLFVDLRKEHLSLHLSGEHQVSTVLAAIAGAVAGGMSIKEASIAASTIHSFRKTMDITRAKNGVVLVDDTFNNNPDAAIAAIQFLSHTKGKKILVFQPMIELGSFTEQAHKEVGAIAGKICDEILLTNSTFSQFFIDGVKESGFHKEIIIRSPQEAAKFIASHTKKDDIVLFKGKEAGRVLHLLKTDSRN